MCLYQLLILYSCLLNYMYFQYIKNHYQNLNWVVEEDKFNDNTPYGIKEFNNIIVTFEPEVKNKLVLSCHYDSKNLSDSRGNYFLAATDSAVPCAILMDVATKLNCALQRKRQERKKVGSYQYCHVCHCPCRNLMQYKCYNIIASAWLWLQSLSFRKNKNNVQYIYIYIYIPPPR